MLIPPVAADGKQLMIQLMKLKMNLFHLVVDCYWALIFVLFATFGVRRTSEVIAAKEGAS